MPIVETYRNEGVATVVLNRPEALNALSNAMKSAIAEAFEKLASDDEVRVVILRGNGRAFCAGADQKENATMDAAAAADRMHKWNRLYRSIRELPKPVVAQIHGYAAGAGFQIALLADMRIGSTDAKLGMTELNIGSPCILGSAILREVAGDAVARRVVMRADFIEAPEALHLNLLNEVVETDVEARVAELAAALAEKPATSMRLTKQWLIELGAPGFDLAIARAHEMHAENYAAGEFSAGAKKFVSEKSAAEASR
jgi:enoyl-CoA hydratase/carnithine racemase